MISPFGKVISLCDWQEMKPTEVCNPLYDLQEMQYPKYMLPTPCY